MATATAPASLQQLLEMEEPQNGYYELHDGAITLMTFPLHDHTLAQNRLVRLLTPRLDRFGVVDKEFPYAATRENARRADVAVISHARWNATPPKSVFEGSPELVVEVVSPSNTPSQLKKLELLCLASGAIQFWTVYADVRLIEVRDNQGRAATYAAGSAIPLDAFACLDPLPVDAIFAE